jgi:hypothetical protein
VIKVQIEEGFRLVLPEAVRGDLQVGDEVIVGRDQAGRINITWAEDVYARLQETFGLWADRDDMPSDSVAYVNAIRAGERLDEAERY